MHSFKRDDKAQLFLQVNSCKLRPKVAKVLPGRGQRMVSHLEDGQIKYRRY